ncbi:unnamed protein product [Paramecium octaurelia]|uniref:Uncharacterized protein n=1 Tax=Paramecium octaurelia TaxID=43137 RepID=A0A8S1W764_PAROT|nr:unnamed protein product [Paramecium octaurelia]
MNILNDFLFQYQYYLRMQSTQMQEQIKNQIQTQFYVYEDLQNFINLLYSLKVVNEHFKGQKNLPMVKICRNKVVLQMNLSNSIHYDLGSQKDTAEILAKEKNQAMNILNQLEPELNEFQDYIKWYKENCLSQNIHLEQQKLEDTNMAANFNQNVLSQIIPAINSMDQKVQNVQDQEKFIAPELNQIKEKAKKYQDFTRESLQKNHQIEEKQIDKKQKIITDDQELRFLEAKSFIEKNFKSFEQGESSQYLSIKDNLNQNYKKNNQKPEEKHAQKLFKDVQIKEFHPLYYKFYLIGQYEKCIQKNNKNILTVNEFSQFVKNNNQDIYNHFLKYLFSIQQKGNFEYRSYCEHYKQKL